MKKIEGSRASADVMPSSVQIPGWLVTALGAVALLGSALLFFNELDSVEDVPDCTSSDGHVMGHHTTYDLTTGITTTVWTCQNCGFSYTTTTGGKRFN